MVRLTAWYHRSKVGQFLEEPTQTKRRWVIAVSLTLAVLSGGAVLGARTYVSDQQAEADLRAAEATFQADVAKYENDRDEWQYCQNRVESSAKLSTLAQATSELGVAVTDALDQLVGLVEQGHPAGGAVEARRIVDDLDVRAAEVTAAASDYQPIDPETCPPEPEPPTPPNTTGD